MAFVRKDVWNLGADWNHTILWYAKAVAELQKRPITDKTSWLYLAAMHGISESRWRGLGYLKRGEHAPAKSDLMARQCQHQSWYFLPWHRGYLSAFEAIVRQAVTNLAKTESDAGLKAAAKDWALPYWNYDASRPQTLKLPFAFTQHTLPDGSHNPLYVTERYGSALDPADVDLSALNDDVYAGEPSGVPPGFGGPPTSFNHGSGPFGDLEAGPHGNVHVVIGGGPQQRPGLMIDPDTAGLDPIFWLHHCNIDRLWQVWSKMSAGNTDPEDDNWLNGPVDRKFEMPAPDGSTFTFAAKQMRNSNAATFNYSYEDVSNPFQKTRLVARLERLGLQSTAPAAVKRVVQRHPAELVGASATAIRLVGGAVDAKVQMDAVATKKVAQSFQRNFAQDTASREPDRIFLGIENITAAQDGASFDVYVGLPKDADPKAHPDNHAGVVSLFGARKATLQDDKHAGNGISVVLDITHIVDALHLNNALDVQSLGVRFVPRADVPVEHGVSIGRINIYRQSH